ncbi:MAG TPA: hypothetical protein VN770_09645 [Gaiellaceae bacterium]|nr:hypothetical protein [Gaiellaceae bacterium]
MPARALAAAGLAAAVVASAWLLPPSVRRLDNRAAAGAQLTGVDRELPAARQYGVPSAAIVRLASLIPRDAVYTIVLPGRGADTARLAFPGLVADYLLPRRNAGYQPGAQYVIAYREPLPRKGLSKIVDVGDGVELGTVGG